ncbi:MAG TPA: ATP-binding protein, partial [Salinimicrobium sp.]|nr:ATP-binding protein [Salinimicrobium sp.]
AIEQTRLENNLAKKANKILFCDTNLLETMVYSQAYYNGFCEPAVLKHALKARYDLYFLTYIDVPWVADDLRDRPNDRELMFSKFKASLDRYNKPYVILKGDYENRFKMAVNLVESLIKKQKIGL